MSVSQLQKIASYVSVALLALWIAFAWLRPLPGTWREQYEILFLLLVLARLLPMAAAREHRVTFVASLTFTGTLYVGPWAAGSLAAITYLLVSTVLRRPAILRGLWREMVVTMSTLPAVLLLHTYDVDLPVQRFTLMIFPALTFAALSFFTLCVTPSLWVTGTGRRESSLSDARAAVTGEAVAFVGGLLLTTLLMAIQLRQAFIDGVVFLLLLAATVWVVRASVDLPSLRQRVRAMEHIGRQSIDAQDLESLPGHLLEAAHDLIQMDQGYVWIIDDDGEHMHLCATWPHDLQEKGTLRIGQGLAGRVAARLHGLTIADGDDPRWERDVTLPASAGNPQSVMGIPLRARDRTMGAALFIHQDPGKYGVRDLHLVQSIANMVGNALENARLHQEMRKDALTDGMTGLVNHRHLQTILQEEFSRAARHGHCISVIMGDVDSFKAYNDTYGHPIGDKLLRRVSDTLRSQVRSSDTVARYGGEEFCIVLPHTAKPHAAAMAERLRAAIAATGFPGKTDEETIHSTMSFGVACFPEDGEEPEQVVKRADEALYRAKRGGKNQVQTAWRGAPLPEEIARPADDTASKAESQYTRPEQQYLA